MVQMVLDGIASTEQMKERINNNAYRIEELKELLKDKEEVPVLLHPNMGRYYQREITSLIQSFGKKEHLHETADLIRGLIDKIVPPKENESGLYIDLKGDLAGILAIAVGNKPDTEKQAAIKQMKTIQQELDDLASNALKTGISQVTDLLVAEERFQQAPEETSDLLVAGAGFATIFVSP